jgi:quinoprotein glucose dehydrogenase
MTYMSGGKQYIVITAGGHALYNAKPGDVTIAFALPE